MLIVYEFNFEIVNYPGKNISVKVQKIIDNYRQNSIIVLVHLLLFLQILPKDNLIICLIANLQLFLEILN